MCYDSLAKRGCAMKKICLVVAALGFFALYAAEQKPCGNSDSYVDMLCKRKQGIVSSESSGSGSSGKMPSTPLVPDFDIEPLIDDGKKVKKDSFLTKPKRI